VCATLHELFNSLGVNESINLKNIVEFFCCIPGTNASIERLFSQMNYLWTNEKNRLSVETVKAMLIVKVFFNKDCVEFHILVNHNHSIIYLRKYSHLRSISEAKIND
jgi:hypothetical protein